MLTFGIIAEGQTDRIVIWNILLGYFQDEEIELGYVEPPPYISGFTAPHAGWNVVFENLKLCKAEKALQFNDYLVIHIDTDMQEEVGFDVPRQKGGKPLSLPERVEGVIDRLCREIDPEFLKSERKRILFAIAVDSIECWMLPLLFPADKKKASKVTGCLKTATDQLRKMDQDGLSAGDTKFQKAYEQASREFRKRKELMNHRDRNPSLELFIQQIDAITDQRIAKPSDDAQDL